jgi:hypothetical protein
MADVKFILDSRYILSNGRTLRVTLDTNYDVFLHILGIDYATVMDMDDVRDFVRKHFKMLDESDIKTIICLHTACNEVITTRKNMDKKISDLFGSNK